MNAARFIRTRRTWQAYLTISFYSYLLNSLGPLTPFLRAELGLSYTAASLHFSAYALGMIITGLLLNTLVNRFGARAMVWTGVAGLCAGTLMLILGRQAWVTISGAFLMGLLGVLISALFSAALAEQHGEHRAIALTESSIIASLLATLAPVAISIFSRTPLSWRGALALMLFAAPVLWLLFGKDPGASDAGSQKAGGEDAEAMKSSAAAAAAAHPRAPLPLTYWIYWVLILLVEAVEFLILLWGADYLEKVSGLSKANAALGMSAFMGSMLVGRALVSRLLRRSQEQRLVLGSLLLSTAGFLLFWLSPGPLPAIFGLLVAGLGVAGQFPILNSLALSSVPGRMVEGSGRITLAVGLAILLLPLLLGRLADWVGIRPAYGLELVLLVTAIGLMLWLGKRKKQGKVTL